MSEVAMNLQASQGTENEWTLSVGGAVTGRVWTEEYCPGTALLKWDLSDESVPLKNLQNPMRELIDHLFANPSVSRLIHYCAPGDYRSAGLARVLGFIPEGNERVVSEPGEIVTFWRSSLLREELALPPAQALTARVIDGARPAVLVGEFHEVYGVPNLVSAPASATVDHGRIDMRMSLIKEEFAELCGAVYGPAAEQALLDFYPSLPDDHERDTVEAADALADLVYVIYGMALESGIDLDRVLAEVQRSNLSKLMPDGSVLHREDGKVLKGPDFSEPDIAAALEKTALA